MDQLALAEKDARIKELEERLALADDLLICHEAIGTKIMDKETWLKGKNMYLQEYVNKPRSINI